MRFAFIEAAVSTGQYHERNQSAAFLEPPMSPFGQYDPQARPVIQIQFQS